MLKPGDRLYGFTMVISPRRVPEEGVDEWSGKFILSEGETIEDARRYFITQYLKDNPNVSVQDMLVVRFATALMSDLSLN